MCSVTFVLQKDYICNRMYLQNTRPFFTEHKTPFYRTRDPVFTEHEILFYRTRGTLFTEHEALFYRTRGTLFTEHEILFYRTRDPFYRTRKGPFYRTREPVLQNTNPPKGSKENVIGQLPNIYIYIYQCESSHDDIVTGALTAPKKYRKQIVQLNWRQDLGFQRL